MKQQIDISLTRINKLKKKLKMSEMYAYNLMTTLTCFHMERSKAIILRFSKYQVYGDIIGFMYGKLQTTIIIIKTTIFDS